LASYYNAFAASGTGLPTCDLATTLLSQPIAPSSMPW